MTTGGRILCSPSTGTLKISGWLTHSPLWCITDLSDLWEEQQRGDDVDIAGVAGVITYARRFAPSRYLLPLIITGWVDEYGLPAANPMLQLRINVKTFKNLMVGPVGVGGTRPVIYTTPDAETWTSQAHVLDIRKSDISKGIWRGDLELTLTRPWTVT
jgi:hypothetical protein